MPKGKLAVQCAHASVEGVLGSSKEKVDAWRHEGMKKAVLKVKDLEELRMYLTRAQAAKLKVALITDAGKTFFETSTTTCCALGPDKEEAIDKITGDLSMV